MVKAKLKNKFGVEIGLEAPRIAYRESIRKPCQKQGRHKKQTGGHGQFGDVIINFEPCDSEQVVFEEKVFGGSVPKNFFPAVEKGVRLAAEKGVLAGYPVVGLKATLLDGSYHPVDSSEMAFIMAAKLAYKAAMPEAGPVLLEPVHTVKVHVPNDNTGDIMGDMTKRRGRVLGMEPDEDGMQTILAEAPLAELSNFTTFLRQTTQGRAGLHGGRHEILPELWWLLWWSRPRSWATWTRAATTDLFGRSSCACLRTTSQTSPQSPVGIPSALRGFFWRSAPLKQLCSFAEKQPSVKDPLQVRTGGCFLVLRFCGGHSSSSVFRPLGR